MCLYILAWPLITIYHWRLKSTQKHPDTETPGEDWRYNHSKLAAIWNTVMLLAMPAARPSNRSRLSPEGCHQRYATRSKQERSGHDQLASIATSRQRQGLRMSVSNCITELQKTNKPYRYPKCIWQISISPLPMFLKSVHDTIYWPLVRSADAGNHTFGKRRNAREKPSKSGSSIPLQAKLCYNRLWSFPSLPAPASPAQALDPPGALTFRATSGEECHVSCLTTVKNALWDLCWYVLWLGCT